MSAQLREVLRAVRPAVLSPPSGLRSPLPSPRGRVADLALDQALKALAGAADHRLAATLACVLPHDGVAPARALDSALRALDALAALPAGATLSLDPGAFGHAPAWLRRVQAQAQHLNVALQFDWLTSDCEADTMDACRDAWLALQGPGRTPPGLTLVGRWQRSRADADWACEQGVAVRIVKGHRADPRCPQQDAGAGFMALVQRVAGRASAVTLATNQPHLVRDALQRLRRAGTRCELELMHGLPHDAALKAARDLGVPVRLYVPWGAAWRPCAVTSTACDPRESGWVVRERGLSSTLRLLPSR